MTILAISKADKKAAQNQLNEALAGSTKTRAVAPSYAAGRAYNAELQKMIREMSKEINRFVMPEVRADNPLAAQRALDAIKKKWTGPGQEMWTDELARRFTNQAVNAGRRGFARSAPGVGVNLYGETPEINEYIEVSSKANASLIESISSRHLEDVEIMVTSNMRSGVRSSEIAKQLSEKYGVTKARAKFIARDQTAKINADITKKRQQQAGFEFFKWIDSDDERVRDRHERIANADVGYGHGVYRWDDLPLSDSGQRISPGQDYQCRCTARPMTRKMVERELGRPIGGVKKVAA